MSEAYATPLYDPVAARGWNLCVDFGTGYSKAAAAPMGAWATFDPSLVRPLTVGGLGRGANPFLLDSAVFVDESTVLLGGAAIQRAAQLEHKKREALRSFKTLLSAIDLARALTTTVPYAVDPARVFQRRDLIVLYLAFLVRSIDRAVAADPMLADAEGRIYWRYASPAWRSAESAQMHDIVIRLFAEAEMVQEALGDELFADSGVSIERSRQALQVARDTATPHARRMGMIFEATAATAYSSIGLESQASHLIVIDMGAGTTDVAALARDGDTMEEIQSARATLSRAGDFIDRILLNMAIERIPALRTDAQKAEFWRSLSFSIRDVKESLFHDKTAAIRHDTRTIKVKLKDVERDRDFKQFSKTLVRAYEHGLSAVVERAAQSGQREIHAIAVGGGAGTPFVRELIQRQPPRSAKMRVVARPATPDWAYSPAFGGNLAPIFPQLAIAIGGALAPDSLLAIR